MKIGRTDSISEPFRFIRIKDLPFFRHLLRDYDLSLLKDYLANTLLTTPIEPNIPYFLFRDHISLPAEDVTLFISQDSSGGEVVRVKSGHVIPEGISEFSSKEAFTLYSISCRTVLILQKLYFLDLPPMRGMKSMEKLAFLERCQVFGLNFNSFAYRRGEEVDAMYYLLEGQVKIFKQLGENIYEVASLEKGRLFGLFQVKSRVKNRDLYARASLNGTKIMKIPLKSLEKICMERETSIESLLSDAKSQLFSMLPPANISKGNISQRKSLLINPQPTPKQQKYVPKVEDSSRVMLQRRLKTFQSRRMIKSSVLQGLLYSKKMLYRVKQLSQRMQNSSNRHSHLESQNPHAVRHFNDKWRRGEKERRGNTCTSTQKEEKELIAERAPLKRLMKYPSVQKFIMETSSTFAKHQEQIKNSLF